MWLLGSLLVQIASDVQPIKNMKATVLLIDDNEMILSLVENCLSDYYSIRPFISASDALVAIDGGLHPDLIVTDLNMPDLNGLTFLKQLKENANTSGIPVMILSGSEKSETRIECLEAGADDFLLKPFHPEELRVRIQKCLIRYVAPVKPVPIPAVAKTSPVKQSWTKRLVDVLVSGSALLILSPLLVLVAVLIRLDSKGPVLYLSKRVGAGYRVFDLYKFRTMKVNADKELMNLQHLNAYEPGIEDFTPLSDSEAATLIGEVGWVDEGRQSAQSSAFLKLKNDPRITGLGRFLRNTSIDELPQLLNILKGDMSLVGNRPLPLYEAEKLTTDQSVARFLAPAGLTGLWQVTKRGKSDLSEEERIKLDNMYALQQSLWIDLKLMAKTVPALFQTETM